MESVDDTLAKELRVLFDEGWYLERYPDVRVSGMDPLQHYIRFGVNEGRDPNRFFEGAWYQEHYPDVAPARLDPLLHYLRIGAGELRNPHPRFDAAWYADQHLEAAANPLVYHMLFGCQRGWADGAAGPIGRFPAILRPAARLPAPTWSSMSWFPSIAGWPKRSDAWIPCWPIRERPAGRVIVVDDPSPEAEAVVMARHAAAGGRILLVRNRRNQGFVASANVGIEAAGTHDVVLLNSDTEVAPGWLARLAGHAYATPRVASVSPFSNGRRSAAIPASAAARRRSACR